MNDDAAAAACEFSSLLTWADDDLSPSPLLFFLSSDNECFGFVQIRTLMGRTVGYT